MKTTENLGMYLTLLLELGIRSELRRSIWLSVNKPCASFCLTLQRHRYAERKHRARCMQRRETQVEMLVQMQVEMQILHGSKVAEVV